MRASPMQFPALCRFVVAGSAALLLNCSGAGGDEGALTSGEAVTNGTTLLVSTSASRGGAKPLQGASLSGSAYVFTSDATLSPLPTGIRQVRYWLDNPSMSGTPTHVENYAAYDFVGTAGDGSAEPWDTTKLAGGAHTITESVTSASGAVTTYNAAFTIGGGSAPPPTPTPAPAPTPTACPSTAVSLSSFGSAGTGGDDTAVLQRAVDTTANAHQVLRIPATSKGYVVGPIHVPSSASLCFDAGVRVEARASWGQFDRMWTIENASNVTMLGYGATFHMNPAIYASDTDPEYRHCVALFGATNVHVAGMTCSGFGGDSLYLGGGTKPYSEGVLVEDFTSEGATRDGLTVIAAKTATVRRSHFNNGHSAVDMEPNVATDRLEDVHLEDSDSTGNHYGGVNVSIYAFTSASTPPSVTVLRHTDRNNALGNADFHAGTSFSVNGNSGLSLGGSVLFDSCTSEDAGSRAAWAAWWTASGPNAAFRNLTIKNPNQNRTAVDGAATAVGRGGGGSGDQGNVTFTGTSITSTDGKIAYYFTYYDGSGFPFSKVQWVSPGTLSGATKAPPNGLFGGAGVNTVNQ
jgi:hypothetical protein